MITATITPYAIEDATVLRLPKEVSAHLPTRGQTMVKGVLAGREFELPLEPDGRGSHYLELEGELRAAAPAGTPAKIQFEPTKNWIEPKVPADLQAALDAHPEIHEVWATITPLARWEWVRWTRSTNNPQTRAHRIEVAISKMNAGTRRPCCWNRNLCTDPAISKSGALLGPES